MKIWSLLFIFLISSFLSLAQSINDGPFAKKQSEGLPKRINTSKPLISNAVVSDQIINDYTEVISFGICKNTLVVSNALNFNAGDTVLLIQMKGAVIDSSNTASFGTITDYKNAGNYEYNYVKSKVGNVIELLNVVKRQYDLPNGKVQLIRVPYFQNLNVTSRLTCLPWDGSKGGVLAFNVQNNLVLNESIDVSGRGFRGATALNSSIITCDMQGYFYTPASNNGGRKGEGIYTISNNNNFGRGAPANAGGGGNAHNAGGGGGSNAGAGGIGGNQWNGCATIAENIGGKGGYVLNNSSVINKLFLGGGGGMGHGNDQNEYPAGSGGGIILIKANSLTSNGWDIIANGSDAMICTSTTVCNDGLSGGGGGGTVLLDINIIPSTVVVEAKGGKGADADYFHPVYPYYKVGPGGGGGGGFIAVAQPVVIPSLQPNVGGGANGVLLQHSNDNYGAMPGDNGTVTNSFNIFVDDEIFKPNIDSVRVNISPVTCNEFDFSGLGFTNTYPIVSWLWNFNDGTTSILQNNAHSFQLNGAYPVKLVATDINGCKDSLGLNISVNCPPDTIINNYTAAISFDICNNILTVSDASAFNVGDTVLLIQMKGAIIDSSNTAAFGTITDYRNAGNYEFNYIKSINGNDIELLNNVEKQYDLPDGFVQLIRVPYFLDLVTNNRLTCLPWDGSKGGVLVFNVENNLTLNTDIDVSGRGFRKGASLNTNNLNWACNSPNFFYPAGSVNGAAKGEGIAVISSSKSNGKGSLANGGGGGNQSNAGGGGGGNYAAGGLGGNQFSLCNGVDGRGLGGKSLSSQIIQNKIFLGGGGGSGDANNPPPPAMFSSFGGNGGGIVIISANTIITTGSRTIKANGDPGLECNTGNCHEGMGGGGAGGSILLNINNYSISSAIGIETKGGKGADAIHTTVPSAQEHGTGGGGGGGLVWFSGTVNPTNVVTNQDGGVSGININYSNNPWGATAGQNGTALTDFVLPVTTTLFVKNIDSVRIRQAAVSCSSFDFNGDAYINYAPVSSWQWDFGDGTASDVQNPSHSYNVSGLYDVKLVVTDMNGCKDSVGIQLSAIALNFDFNYSLDVCNPLTVQFNGIGTTTTNASWNFGDGNTNTGSLNPVNVYTSEGDYVVWYSVSSGGCQDTITKTISLHIIADDIILTPDTTICYGSVKQLRTIPALSFCWSPVTYLDDPYSPQPTTSAQSDITYYFTAEAEGNNVIVNGDFSQGNTGFTSAYTYVTPNITEGEYFVGSNPQVWNASFSPCTDHTTGNGNMMMVNGASAADVVVWKQTVTVTPNSNYSFSAWVQALWPPNPAQLQFSINGKDVGALITASIPVSNWTRFYTTWNSGNSITADIAIVNKNIQVTGNDFALDDISFSPVFIKRDSIKISVDNVIVQTNNDTTVCTAASVQLNSSGAQQYIWTPATDLSDPTIANPIASVLATTQYVVTGTSVNGCSASDTVVISVFPVPVMTISSDTLICKNISLQLNATGGVSYSWSPAATLNDPFVPNPVASPVSSTNYYLTYTDANFCTYVDSVLVDIIPAPLFSVNADKQICLNGSVQLNASGGDIYSWQPAPSLTNSTIADPLASPNITTTYFVNILDTACNESVSLSTQVIVMALPVVHASKSNDIDCSFDKSQLTATGANFYNWSPSATLTNPSISNPVATPLATTDYIVQGTDANGCFALDTIRVNVDNINKGGYLMPTAFTPNSDGLNDCYRIKYWGVIEELEFSIFNRWGERVFYTTDPNKCWDGTYKGVKQDTGVFVYMIKAKTFCDSSVFRKGTFALIR